MTFGSFSAESLEKTLRDGFGADVHVAARRPGLFQVSMPAYLNDGDAAIMFVKAERNGGLRVSDLAHTLMRQSYSQSVTEAMKSTISRLAENNGFSMSNGEISATVAPRDLFAATMGMIQIQAQAESLATARQMRSRSEDFRRIVMDFLRLEFAERIQENVLDDEGHEEFALDAVVTIGGRELAVAAVPSDIEAERAVANRYRWAEHSERGRGFKWVALTKDLDSLASRSKSRLLKAYWIPSATFDIDAIPNRLRELVA